MMTTLMSTMEAKEQLADLVNRVSTNKERVILTRRGIEVAAIVSLDDIRKLYEIQNKNDLLMATDALKEARKMGTISLNQLKEDIGL